MRMVRYWLTLAGLLGALGMPLATLAAVDSATAPVAVESVAAPETSAETSAESPATPPESKTTIAETDTFKLKPETPRSDSNGMGAASLQMTLGLVLVLAVIVGLSWLVRKFNLGIPGTASNMKVIGAMNVGPKEKILVLEVENRRLLIGVTAHQISLLQSLDDIAPETGNHDFAERMQVLLKAGTVDDK